MNTKINLYFKKTKRQGDRESERQRDRETERQRDRETERQRDGETERQRDRETERQKDRKTERKCKEMRFAKKLPDNHAKIKSTKLLRVVIKIVFFP